MFYYKKSKITAVTIASILVFAIGVPALADEPLVPDTNLFNALVAVGDANSDGQITQDEITALSGDLDLSNKGIVNITGLEYATGVSSINLQTNKIRDIQPLSTLIDTPHAITSVNLQNNYLDITEGSDDRTIIDKLIGQSCVVAYEPQDAVRVEGLTLNTDALYVDVGGTDTLTVTVTPDDAANKNVTWTSSDESIAAVAADGTVTGVGAGQATITAASEQDSNITAACTVTVKKFSIESTTYSIDRSQGIIKNVPKMTTLTDFLSKLSNETSDLTVVDADGNLCVDTTLKTGMKVKLNIGGTERDALDIVVSGDSNGDGAISVSDYTLARLDILGLNSLSGVYKTACDINGDGNISITDYTAIRLDILGIKAINELPDLPEVTNSSIRAFLNVALMQQGKPYVWSEEGPDSFDCSGYVYYCLRQIGYSVGRSTANTYSQNENWLYVPRDQLQPGDLMFYKSDSNPNIIGHIGIYLGNGYHIHASSSYGCVIICRVEGWYDEMLQFGRRVFY